MRDDPGADRERIEACLHADYGVRLWSLQFLPVGHDLAAAVYRVGAEDGSSYLLKIRTGPAPKAVLAVPAALAAAGIPNVRAPVRTRSGAPWCPLPGDGPDASTVTLFPFVDGASARTVGLTSAQWRAFGSTLRAVHDSGLADGLRAALCVERFALPSAAKVHRLLELVEAREFASPAAARVAVFWRANADRIRRVLARAEELGSALRARAFDEVLCHADIHGANVIAAADGSIVLIDWDAALIAPRERDLLFVIGSRIGRAVLPREEALFFVGYGAVEIDPDALIYFRYERIVEDIGEFAEAALLRRDLSEAARASEADLAMRFFDPGGDVDAAEIVRAPAGVILRQAAETRIAP